jgi:phage shock protein B
MAVPFVFVSFLSLAFLAGFVLLLVFLVKQVIHNQKPDQMAQSGGDDIQIIQEILQGLERMEKRVEALETILLDRARDQERV